MKRTISAFLLLSIGIACLSQDSLYKLGPASYRKQTIPKGVVTRYEWESKLYNNFREYWIYVPAQYDSARPAALMVFQDGHSYVNDSGDFRVPIVYDNLIYQKKLPVTICLFVNPGHNSKGYPQNRFRASNRADEYDVLNDKYATMLIDEIIPELKKKYNISNDPKMHGIGGLSSGAICAFTVAWERPDYFHKVLSHIGSYANIRGGHNYPFIIRNHKKKDIKIFMQDGTNDLDNEFGNWWLANLQMESALKFKGYEFKFEKGTGMHDGKHGGAILPESLTWLWSDILIK
ncbi:MAG TPA: alpha/beta hydrolase-fold protein [Chitinophagaceae bacterium]|nr:alpha/beta hydrolase-fold protein [Chitinophagaceae bacterium]